MRVDLIRRTGLQGHIKRIRAYLNIKPADKKAHSTALKAMKHAVCTKEDIVDILNVGIEELFHLRYELPKFDHLLPLDLKPQNHSIGL